MASLTITEVAASSSFMGAALKGAVAPAQARVTMAFAAQDLQSKPLSLLRVLAIQRGVKGSPRTKAEIVAALLGVSPASSRASSSRPTAAVPGGSAFDAMSLGELRVLAKQRGLRGDTKKELIQLLVASGATASSAPTNGAVAASSYSNGAAAAPAAYSAPTLSAAILERKSLAELRAMARIRGLRGDTKKELVKLLAAPAGSSSPSSNGSAVSYSNGAAASNGASYTAAAPQQSTQTMRNLQTKSLSHLRAIANVRGITGTTKADLVRQLAAVM